MNELPFVSVCTPTFNRRPFIPYLKKCFLHQTYPQERMEWIVVDDGTDKIKDLLLDIPNLKYFYIDDKMTLGKKRNFMHTKCKGDIIVYMDDDDYYPTERVSHAVERLLSDDKVLCSGASELYVWFNELNKMVKFGPYSSSHATAGTFAFKKELLNITRYNDDACLAEEREFLKNYTIPFIQLDGKKSILVFSHEHNTYDKAKLLENSESNPTINNSDLTPKDFIEDPELYNFYTTLIHKELKEYDLGSVKYKPDVIKQTNQIEEERKKNQQQHQKCIVRTNEDGSQTPLSLEDIVVYINTLKREIKKRNDIIKQLLDKNV